MRLPEIQGLIDRRILLNYRVVPEVLERLVPPPFRPLELGGWGMAGICLIRLREIRPRFVPRALGIRSENAAHRIAVQWPEGGRMRQGVYIPRRDTSHRLNVLAGGRLFPGEHHLARFDVVERHGFYHAAFTSRDGRCWASFDGRLADNWTIDSIFPTLEDASDFFAAGSVGYSATHRPGYYDGIELRSDLWRVEPLVIQRAASSWFDNPALFPAGSLALDSALLMRRIPHRWRSQPGISVTPTPRRCNRADNRLPLQNGNR